MLENVPELSNFKDAIKEPDLLETIEKILETFNERVIPAIPTLEKGIIHGDMNEHNILVKKHNSGK